MKRSIAESQRIIHEYLGKGWEHPKIDGSLPWGDFHTSWDWLMPVISRLNMNVQTNQALRNYFEKTSYCYFILGDIVVDASTIERVHDEIVTGIEKYVLPLKVDVPIHMKLEGKIDGFEVHGCKAHHDGQMEFIEQVDDSESEFFGAYVHYAQGGLDHITDFKTRDEAESFTKFLTNLILHSNLRS